MVHTLLLALSVIASAVSASPLQAMASGKIVSAHHMVGNTYPYSRQDWAEDIRLAKEAGIDAFALNVGAEDWQRDRVADAYAAAEAANFKLFLSLDVAVQPCSTAAHGQSLRALVARHVASPAQLLYTPPGSNESPKALLSTFAGSDCTFGAGDSPSGWYNEFTNHQDLRGRIHFVPSFFVDPRELSGSGRFGRSVHGSFNWNSGWANELTVASAENIMRQAGTLSGSLDGFLGATNDLSAISRTLAPLNASAGSTQTDINHVNAIGDSRTYMAAVSPWFFTHYGADTYNKNWMYLSDFHLYARKWENLLKSDVYSKIDLIEITTWNDFGESSYISPIKGDMPPTTRNWVDGMDHTGWLKLTKYYAQWFKTGTAPQLTQDSIVMWARPQPVKATVNDPVGRPRDYQLHQDTLWVVVLAKSAGRVTLSTSPTGSGGDTRSFDVQPGANKLSLPLTPGSHMYARLERGGARVLEVHPSQFVFGSGVGAGRIYNFNAFVASGTA